MTQARLVLLLSPLLQRWECNPSQASQCPSRLKWSWQRRLLFFLLLEPLEYEYKSAGNLSLYYVKNVALRIQLTWRKERRRDRDTKVWSQGDRKRRSKGEWKMKEEKRRGKREEGKEGDTTLGFSIRLSPRPAWPLPLPHLPPLEDNWANELPSLAQGDLGFCHFPQKILEWYYTYSVSFL